MPGNSRRRDRKRATAEGGMETKAAKKRKITTSHEGSATTFCQSGKAISCTKQESQAGVRDLEKLAYEDQGDGEMEFCSGEESELRDKLKSCAKNSSHEKFIPVANFAQPLLPESYRGDKALFDCIQALVDVTVRVVVDLTSKKRPKNTPLHKIGGKPGLLRYGSGFVWCVIRKFSEKDGYPCPCVECKTSSSPKKQWGMYAVDTSVQMVYDEAESQHTRCDLWFDMNEDEDQHMRFPYLTGVELLFRDQKSGSTRITCVSHDAETCEKLEKMVRRRERVEQKYKKSEDDSRSLVVMVAHLHGMSKVISLGEWTTRQGKNRGNSYTNVTCLGCSGAPFLSLKPGEPWLLPMTHIT